ncbi:MAG: hypothetical protein AMS16_07060 [Planctomycetes bacterium DG_58]|nr:MAG: hypothetical protein AMS16_07060 [Planctomycetes bacterium DG_58]
MSKPSRTQGVPRQAAPRLPGTAFVRPRSLLWVLPERAARWTSWLIVVVLCVVPVVILLVTALAQSIDREERTLAALLSERLSAPVRLGIIGKDAPGQYRLSEISIGAAADRAAVAARAPKAGYHAPGDELPGRLDLEGGTVWMDLDAWTRAPSGSTARMLHNIRSNKDLRSVSLSNCTVELHLADERISLRKCVGRAELAENSNIQGGLVGHVESGPGLGLTFELADAGQRVTITGKSLPWVAKLMTPSLGETLAGLLAVRDGKLTLANELATGSGSGDNWMLEVHSVLELSRLPETLGLGEMTGKLDVVLRAWGVLGRPAKLTARLHLGEAAKGTISDRALRNLRALLWGQWTETPEKTGTHTFDALELSLIVTPNFICLTRDESDPPSGIFDPAGEQLLPGPMGEFIPIDEFLERLDMLRRLWTEDHSG